MKLARPFLDEFFLHKIQFIKMMTSLIWESIFGITEVAKVPGRLGS